MRTVKLNGMDVRVDENGFVNTNDLHKASGENKSKRPSYFLQNDSIKKID